MSQQKTFKQKNPEHRIYKEGEAWFIYCCKNEGRYLKSYEMDKPSLSQLKKALKLIKLKDSKMNLEFNF